MTDLKLVGRGRTADIFAWSPGQVLKLFHAGWREEQAAREARLTHAVHSAGLPVPAVADVDIIELDGRYGFVCERIDGPTLLSAMTAKPWTLFRAARLLAELHLKISACTVPGLASQHQALHDAIASVVSLSIAMRHAAQQVLSQLPDGDRLCHGDFHPDNVVLSQHGPVIIDWVTATRGNPLGDAMRTSMLLTVASPNGPALQRWLIRCGRAVFHHMYLRHYAAQQHILPANVVAWAKPIYAARLAEGIAEEHDSLMKLVAQHMA